MREELDKIIEYLIEDVQIELKDKEYVSDVEDEIKNKKHGEKKWFNNAWGLIIVSKNDSYHWDKWGHPDLNYLLLRTLVLLDKAKKSKKGFEHLKTFLKKSGGSK